MTSPRDFDRARNRASAGMPQTRMPRNAAEAMGQVTGEAERRRITENHNWGRSDGSGADFALAVVAGILVLGLIGGATLTPLIYPALAIAGLATVGFVKRRLGLLTPVYVGVLVGILLGSAELLITGARVNLFNLTTFMFLGGTVGAIAIPVMAARRR